MGTGRRAAVPGLYLVDFLDSNNDQQTVTDVSVAFGNVVLADHGLSFSNRPLGTVPPPALFYPANPRRSIAVQTDAADTSAGALSPDRSRQSAHAGGPLAIVPLAGVGNPVTPTVVLLGGIGSDRSRSTPMASPA